MATPGKPIPDGFHSITSALVLKDSRKAIAFYKKAFGAEEVLVFPGPDGQGVMYAEIKIGDSMMQLGDENPQWGSKSAESFGGSPVSFYLYVKDVDKVFQKAVDAGAEPLMPVTDQFYGDRSGRVKDPFGYQWSIATHTLDMTPEEIDKAAKEWMAQAAQQK